MKINKGYIAVGLVIAFALFFELAAHADEWDQATRINFNEPIQIPGQVLPAGNYLFRLIDGGSDRNTVEIFSSDRTVLYATLQTIATERPEATGDTTIALAEQAGGKPDALLKWFYPGCVTGTEFVYSGQEEKELAQHRQQTVVPKQQTVPNADSAAAGN